MDRPTINDVYGPEGFVGYECMGFMVELEIFEEFSPDKAIIHAKQLLMNILLSKEDYHA